MGIADPVVLTHAETNSTEPPAPDDPGRDESVAERDDRNLNELIQELRVAGLGVQVLFGFLLSLPFTARFSKLDGTQRSLYVTSLLLAAAFTALLCAPVVYHRLLFRRHQKERVLKVANIMAILGLSTVGLAISTAVILVVGFVDRGAPAIIIGVATVVSFVSLWFAFPLAARRESRGHPS
jgi:hypothetical protein